MEVSRRVCLQAKLEEKSRIELVSCDQISNDEENYQSSNASMAEEPVSEDFTQAQCSKKKMLDQNSESIQELKQGLYQNERQPDIIEEANESDSDASGGYFRPTDIQTPEVSEELVTPQSSTNHAHHQEEMDWRYSDSLATPADQEEVENYDDIDDISEESGSENLSPSPCKYSKKSYKKTNSLKTLRDC
jgi:hypothetical protein